MESNNVAPKRNDNKGRAYLGNTKLHNELSNPCMKEGDLSRLCLEDNNYDKEPCEVYFINYRKCRSFWNKVISERRMQGLLPYLPLPEERAEIKAKYFASKT